MAFSRQPPKSCPRLASALVQTMINAEISRLSAREISQRFLKSIMKQVGILSGQNPDEDDDDTIPTISASKAE
jgi:hypothetical protein